MPKVAIIIPVYNTGKYLERCLDSVINQTYKNLEIICVNDCSTDNSIDTVKNYANKDRRIKYIEFKVNKGVSCARNEGIKVAKGEYIYFLDSDDWIDLDYIEKMLETARRTKADIVVNKNIVTEFKDKSQIYVHPNENKIALNNYINGCTEVNNVFWSVCNKLYKTSFLTDNKLMFPEGYINEDLYYHYISFVVANSIYYTAQTYYHYLDRNNSISKTHTDAGIDYLKIYNIIYDYYADNNLINKKIKLYSTMPSFNIKNEEIYKVYKAYFDKVINYLNQNAEIFNELDLYFANSVANSKDYADYASKYPASATISYIRRKK